MVLEKKEVLDRDHVSSYLQENYGIGEENFSGGKYSYQQALKETFQSMTGFSFVQDEGVIAVVNKGEYRLPIHLTESYDFIGIESIYEYTEFMNHCIESYNDVIQRCELLPKAIETIPDDDPRKEITQRFKENMQTFSFNKERLRKEDITDEIAENMVLFYDLLGELQEEICLQKRLDEMKKQKSKHESKEPEL